MAKSHHMEQQAEGSEQKAICHLFDRAQKWAQDTTDTRGRTIHASSVLPQLLVEHVCHSGLHEGGGPPSSAREQLIKLKFINFNSADPKFALESIFRFGRLTQPQVAPDVQTWV